LTTCPCRSRHPLFDGIRVNAFFRRHPGAWFAAFNINDGTVIGQLHRQHRATEFKRF
jgi:hypothetical protein